MREPWEPERWWHSRQDVDTDEQEQTTVEDLERIGWQLVSVAYIPGEGARRSLYFKRPNFDDPDADLIDSHHHDESD